MDKEILLQLKDVCVSYKGLQALNFVDIEIDEGEIIALMGPNGAGKSTILKTIFGLVPIESGKILWRAKKITPVSYESAELGIAFVPQGRRVFQHLTIEENLEIGGFGIKSKNELQRRIKEVMDFFPALHKKRNVKSGALSGGEQQMLALGRGLMIEPKLLLLDEPSLGLSPKVITEVFKKIKEINENRKTAIMIVEHNIKSLLNIAHRAYILDKGKIVAHGSSDEILSKNFIENIFLGNTC